MKTCVVCEKRITEQFWVCRACEEAHSIVGVPFRKWPKWIKALVAIKNRDKRYRRNFPITYVVRES